MSTITAPVARRRHASRFLRHLVEMTAAMMVGMAAYGAVLGSILSARGGSLESTRVERPELFALGMAVSMAVPMVAWMRHRGHGWRLGAEMTAAMVVPALVLIACYRLDGIAAGAVCSLACAAMVPAMAVAMLFRLDEYAAR